MLSCTTSYCLPLSSVWRQAMLSCTTSSCLPLICPKTGDVELHHKFLSSSVICPKTGDVELHHKLLSSSVIYPKTDDVELHHKSHNALDAWDHCTSVAVSYLCWSFIEYSCQEGVGRVWETWLYLQEPSGRNSIAFPLSMGMSVPEDTVPTVIIENRVTPLLYLWYSENIIKSYP